MSDYTQSNETTSESEIIRSMIERTCTATI